MNSLQLDGNWDLTLDGAGNIALASEPLSMAQDAASNIRLFSGELYLDTTQGIPYFQQILGYSPSLALIKAYFIQAALAVPGVASAKCFITSLTGRTVTGQVQITASSGQTAAADF